MKRALIPIMTSVVALALSGCGLSYSGLDLPGSRAAGSTYPLAAQFDDVLNLSEGAPIKMGGLAIGKVRDVRTDGMKAVADLDIDARIHIPVGSTARLRYDTPLGQMLVQINASSSTHDLPAHATIPDSSTETAPTVEDTLSEASLLINGGGLAQLQTITHELDAALNGREDTVRSLLDNSELFLHNANAGAQDVSTALVALDGASHALAARRRVIANAIAQIGPAAKVLTADTPLLTQLLAQTSQLTGQANDVMTKTQAALLSLVEQLGPILDQVIASTPNYLHGTQSLASVADKLPVLVPGDFAPLNITLTLNLQALLAGQGSTSSGGSGGSGGSSGSGGLLPGLPGLGGLLGGTPNAPTSGAPSLGGLVGGLLGGR